MLYFYYIGELQKAIDDGKIDPSKPVDVDALKTAGLVGKPKDGIRLLGNGNISSKIEVHVIGASKPAILAVEKKGGSVVLTQSDVASK